MLRANEKVRLSTVAQNRAASLLSLSNRSDTNNATYSHFHGNMQGVVSIEVKGTKRRPAWAELGAPSDDSVRRHAWLGRKWRSVLTLSVVYWS